MGAGPSLNRDPSYVHVSLNDGINEYAKTSNLSARSSRIDRESLARPDENVRSAWHISFFAHLDSHGFSRSGRGELV